MSTRTAVTRYAKALLDVAATEAAATTVERDLGTLVEAMHANRELQQALTSPQVSASGKRKIVSALSERLGFAAETRRGLELLAERDRLGMLDEVLAVYRERLLQRQRIQRAEVRSAVPLSPEATQALEARLSQVTGATVKVETLVDPSLIGGVMATVGSTVYDGTVKTQLENLRKQLVGQA
jgi:F-type H+-transporting ATPase subunit delta